MFTAKSAVMEDETGEFLTMQNLPKMTVADGILIEKKLYEVMACMIYRGRQIVYVRFKTEMPEGVMSHVEQLDWSTN